MTEAELQPLVTRCPDCATQFKVSEAQLQVANGKVRCGSCLAVFEGVDNLVWDSDFESDESADVTLDDLLDQLKDDDSTVESELVGAENAAQLDSVLAVDEPGVTPSDVDHPSAPQLKTEAAPPLGLGEEIDPQDAFDREAAANQIVLAANASTQPAVAFAVEYIEVPPEEALLDLGSNYIGPDYASLKRSPAHQQEQQNRSRNRREAMAEMRALAAQREAEEAAAPIDEARIADTPASVPAVTKADLQAASAAAPTGELEQVWERKAEPETSGPTVTKAQADVRPELDSGLDGAAATVRSWRVPLAVAALVLLIAQIMYLQFDDWAIDPTFRPAYAAVCGVLPCDLPDRRALDLLKSRALKVRSHPQDEGRLLVDALIVNEADFDQPFPVLHLKFASVEGNPLASERFAPADYLAGDMAGVKMMPARTPVHIEVKALDPGTQAVSYTLDFE